MTLLGKWKLKRYLLTYTMKSMPIVYILLLGIVAILFFPISFAENSTAWIGGYVLAPILCIFVVKNILKDVKVLNRQWGELQQQEKLEQMLEDYRNSEKAVGGNLYVGEHYLFGKGSMRVVPYHSIRKIHMVNAERKGKIARDLRYEDEVLIWQTFPSTVHTFCRCAAIFVRKAIPASISVRIRKRSCT